MFQLFENHVILDHLPIRFSYIEFNRMREGSSVDCLIVPTATRRTSSVDSIIAWMPTSFRRHTP